MSEQIEIDWDYPDLVKAVNWGDMTPNTAREIYNNSELVKSSRVIKILEPETQSNIEDTLAQRGLRYGKFENHAKIAQGIQDVLRAAPNWDKLDADMRQALSVIADKIARILNGDPYYEDNWHDIAGYSKLVEDRVRKEGGA